MTAPGRARAVSTVLDAAVFLLLVSAAVGLLVAAPEGDADGGDVAPEAATTVATATATVEYDPDRAFEDWNGGRRRTHGTLAGLLASAAVASATDEGRPLSSAPAYVSGVNETVERALTGVGGDAAVQVRAVWAPVPDAGPAGEVVVGPTPPPDADVHAATITVPVDGGLPARPGPVAGAADRSAGRDLTRVAERRGYEGLAEAIARRTIAVLHPPERTAVALGRSNPDRVVAVQRYEATAAAVGVGATRVPVDGNASHTNRLLADALADRLEPGLRRAYDSPTAAAAAADPGTVTVVVRTWSDRPGGGPRA